MILDRVTVTGADDSTDPKELINLSKKYPFVEWAILLSRSSEGQYRFPSLKWMESLRDLAKDNPIKLAGHLCGRWVNDLLSNNHTFYSERPSIVNMFQRVQLNFHGQPTSYNDLFIESLEKMKVQYIFQIDNRNNNLFDLAIKNNVNAVPLFDLSHGAGVSPEAWPQPYPNIYCGYAGGIGPQNIKDEIRKVKELGNKDQLFWVDFETKVRSYSDSLFDLFKVEDCLEKSSEFMGRV